MMRAPFFEQDGQWDNVSHHNKAVFKSFVDPGWLLLVDAYFGAYTVQPTSLGIIIIN